MLCNFFYFLFVGSYIGFMDLVFCFFQFEAPMLNMLEVELHTFFKKKNTLMNLSLSMTQAIGLTE